MQLTQKQIQQIDTFLKGIGIEYLDIRLEMVDHIASEIEEKVTDTPIFFAYNKLQTPFLKYMMSKKETFLKNYRTQRKKAFKNTFLKIIKDSKELLITPKKSVFLLLFFGLILFFGKAHFELFTKTLVVLSCLGFLVFLFFLSRKNSFKKVRLRLSVLNTYFLVLIITSSQIFSLFDIFSFHFREVSYFDFYLVFTCCALQFLISSSLYKNHQTILKKYQFIHQV